MPEALIEVPDKPRPEAELDYQREPDRDVGPIPRQVLAAHGAFHGEFPIQAPRPTEPGPPTWPEPTRRFRKLPPTWPNSE